MQDASHIAEQLFTPGPLGVITLFVMAVIALHKGYLRLGREVTTLEAALLLERTRGDKWQEIALTQLRQTDRAIAVAKTATSIVTGAQP